MGSRRTSFDKEMRGGFVFDELEPKEGDNLIFIMHNFSQPSIVLQSNDNSVSGLMEF